MHHPLRTIIAAALSLAAASVAPVVAVAGSLPGPSPAGFVIFSDISAARAALRDGDPASARTLVTNGRMVLERVRARGVYPNRAGNPPGDWIIVTDQVLLARDTAPEQGATTKGPLHARTNQADDARSAGQFLGNTAVDIEFVRLLMPVTLTEDRLGTAINLIEEKRYPDADLALKQAEGGLRLDPVMLYSAAPGRKGK